MWKVVRNSSSLILLVFMPLPIRRNDVFRGDGQTCEVIEMRVVGDRVKHRGDGESDKTQLDRLADIKKLRVVRFSGARLDKARRFKAEDEQGQKKSESRQTQFGRVFKVNVMH